MESLSFVNTKFHEYVYKISFFFPLLLSHLSDYFIVAFPKTCEAKNDLKKTELKIEN